MSSFENYGQSGEPTAASLDNCPIKSDRRRNPASVKANRIALAARLERNRLATLNRLRRTIIAHPTIAADLAQHLPQPPPNPPQPPA